MRKRIDIPVERDDKDNTYTTDVLTGMCTVYSDNGWIKMILDDETYWIHRKSLKKLLKIMKKTKDD